MKRPLAYITAAWCGEPETDTEMGTRYSRMAYEAGFSPVCPVLYMPLFLSSLAHSITPSLSVPSVSVSSLRVPSFLILLEVLLPLLSM